MFNIIYYPFFFFKHKNILSRIDLFLSPGREHSQFFENIPIIGFKIRNRLKDILLRDKVPPLNTKRGFCGPCNKQRWKFIKMLPKHISLNDHLQSAFIQSDHRI